MRVERVDRRVTIHRTESDKPAVPRPEIGPAKVTQSVFNSWRTRYNITFTTSQEARAAEARVLVIGDFDKAAAWLDTK